MSSKQQQAPEMARGLLELLRALTLASDLEGALAAVVEAASSMVRCDGCAVIWASGDYLRVLNSRGDTAARLGLVLPAGQMWAARLVLEGGRCVLLSDTAAESRWQQVPGEERARSWLGIPLVRAERAVGLLEWTAREPRRFMEADVSIGSEIAEYAAPSLHSALLVSEMRLRLSELSEQVERRWGTFGPGRPVDLDAELSLLVGEAQQTTQARHAFAFVFDEDIGLMRCVAATGDRDKLMKMHLLGDGSVGGWAIPGGRVRKARHPSDKEVLSALRCNSFQVLPLRVRGEVVGMLGVADNLPSRSFPPDAIRVMTHLASQASLLLDRSFQAKPQSSLYDFGAVVQSSPLGICAFSLAGDILFCNSSMADLLSRSAQTLVGRNMGDYLVSADQGRLRHMLEEVALTKQRLQVDLRLRAATGEQRHVRMWLASLRGGEGGGDSVVAIAEDITALKILEQERVQHLEELREKNAQLSELDQLKSRFVANVSHELRTPLAVIKLFAALARKGRPEKRDHYLQTIEQETHRLETIVENVLDLSRMDRRVLQAHPEQVDAAQIAAQVVEVYAESAKRKGIELTNDIKGPLPPIWADRNHLVQILTNLVDNAVRCTAPGGRVWVEGEVVSCDMGSCVEVQVSDTGSGIADDEQDKVFERFYRGRNSPGMTGTGLGLAIVRELLTQNHGTVALRSKLGEGSTFTLRFPALNQPHTLGGKTGGVPEDGLSSDPA